MKITSLINFGFIPQKPFKKEDAKIFENRNNNADFSNFNKSLASINKAFIVFKGSQPSITKGKKDKIIELYTQGVSTSKIAEQIGYDNLPTFTESFKRVTGYTPKEYKMKFID